MKTIAIGLVAVAGLLACTPVARAAKCPPDSVKVSLLVAFGPR